MTFLSALASLNPLKTSLDQCITAAWYGDAAWLILLRPLESLYTRVAAHKRRQAQPWQAPVPVIIVGNIVVGGTGKTPLLIRLVEHLQGEGFRPGILSRGYKGECTTHPQLVRASDSAEAVGDEPALLARRLCVPVCIDPDRVRGAQYLLAQSDCDVLLCDDGLQHYALGRDIEIAVVDGHRRFGNGRCLPAGPLREPLARLREIDFVVGNGADDIGECSSISYRMDVLPTQLVPLLADPSNPGPTATVPLASLEKVIAVSGIGNPQRFFQTLRDAGLIVVEKPFPDHHKYSVDDLAINANLPIVMTEKDAVKCRDLQLDADLLQRIWYLQVDAVVAPEFTAALSHKLQTLGDS